MKGNALRTALAVVLTFCAVGPAHAFRCGTRIITPGDHADKILKFCGEPTAVQTRLSQRAFVSKYGRYFPGLIEEVWLILSCLFTYPMVRLLLIFALTEIWLDHSPNFRVLIPLKVTL